MATFRENLKDHPIVSLLALLASLATIVGFIWALCQSNDKQVKSDITNPNDSTDMEIRAKDNELLKDSTNVSPIDSTKPNHNSQSNNEKAEESKPKETTKVKNNDYDLNNLTYCSMNMSNCYYYIKFYDFDGKRYKFIGYDSAYNFHGSARVKGDKITVYNKFGNSELFLSNEGNYLTGSLWNEHGREMSINYQLGRRD